MLWILALLIVSHAYPRDPLQRLKSRVTNPDFEVSVAPSLMEIPSVPSCGGFKNKLVNNAPGFIGEGHGQDIPDRGSAPQSLSRISPHLDSSGNDFVSVGPDPRHISNLVCAQGDRSIPETRGLAASIWMVGQILDHDISLVPVNTQEPLDAPVVVPVDSTDVIADIQTKRALFSLAEDGVKRNPTNVNNAYVDMNFLYASDWQRARYLRAFDGGRMRTSDLDGKLLPFNVARLDNALPADRAQEGTAFIGGDVRVNENTVLCCMHHLWMRNHNYWADKFASCNPYWSDEQIFQAARRRNIAEWQAIIYEEFLPALLGHPMPQPNHQPGLPTAPPAEFTGAGFRVGHTLLTHELERFSPTTGCKLQSLFLKDAFGNIQEVLDNGIEPIILGMHSSVAQQIDNFIIDDVRNELNLDGRPTDLISLNLIRSRDYGISHFNVIRQNLGLPKHKDVTTITSNVALQQALSAAYPGGVDDIEAFIGFISEDHAPGHGTGPALDALLTQTFQRLRDGDAYYYEFDHDNLTPSQIYEIKTNTYLSNIVLRNTNIKQDFLSPTSNFFYREDIKSDPYTVCPLTLK